MQKRTLKHRILVATASLFAFGLFVVAPVSPVFAQTPPEIPATETPAATGSCDGGSFFGFPTWYRYLPKQETANGGCRPKMESLYDIWLVLAGIIDILLRIAAISAIVFVTWGGIRYTQSRGDPAATKEARQTIINGIVGMVIAIAASAIVNFIASRFG